MPNESGLTPLGDFAYQNFFVGNPPVLLFTEDKRRVDRDLLTLSMQLRQVQATERLTQALEALMQIANVLDGTQDTQTTHLSIQLDQADDFRNLVDHIVRREFWPNTDVLAITGWQIIGESSVLDVSLNFTNGEALLALGRYWQELLTKHEQEGGHRA